MGQRAVGWALYMVEYRGAKRTKGLLQVRDAPKREAPEAELTTWGLPEARL